MSIESNEKSGYVGKSSTELKTIARIAYGEAKKAKDPLEILAFLQVTSEALEKAGLPMKQVDLNEKKIENVASHAYHGLAPEASDMRGRADKILSSFPQAKK